MPCIRCGNITVKLCTCSIDGAKQALSTWSEAELNQAINTLRAVLDAKQKRQEAEQKDKPKGSHRAPEETIA